MSVCWSVRVSVDCSSNEPIIVVNGLKRERERNVQLLGNIQKSSKSVKTQLNVLFVCSALPRVYMGRPTDFVYKIILLGLLYCLVFIHILFLFFTSIFLLTFNDHNFVDLPPYSI